jgi:hypothetical protein
VGSGREVALTGCVDWKKVPVTATVESGVSVESREAVRTTGAEPAAKA